MELSYSLPQKDIWSDWRPILASSIYIVSFVMDRAVFQVGHGPFLVSLLPSAPWVGPGWLLSGPCVPPVQVCLSWGDSFVGELARVSCVAYGPIRQC